MSSLVMQTLQGRVNKYADRSKRIRGDRFTCLLRRQHCHNCSHLPTAGIQQSRSSTRTPDVSSAVQQPTGRDRLATEDHHYYSLHRRSQRGNKEHVRGDYDVRAAFKADKNLGHDNSVPIVHADRLPRTC